MYRLLLFLRRIYVPLIFVVLEAFALHFWASSSVHSRARVLSASDRLVGGMYGLVADAGAYTDLAGTNRLLEMRVERLENELAAYREVYEAGLRDSIKATAEFPHRYLAARVVRNSINRLQNYIMVDKGARDSVRRGMAVLSLDGCMVGYVESCSDRNAICVSVLSTGFRASGTVGSTGHFGSISWRGGDVRTVRLSEVPKYAEIARGDTIRTSGYSFNFPAGIVVGTIEDFTEDEARASYDIDVRLGADVASLRNVILVESPEMDDLIELEASVVEAGSGVVDGSSSGSGEGGDDA